MVLIRVVMNKPDTCLSSTQRTQERKIRKAETSGHHLVLSYPVTTVNRKLTINNPAGLLMPEALQKVWFTLQAKSHGQLRCMVGKENMEQTVRDSSCQYPL